MDKEHPNSNKKNKIKSCKSQVTKQKTNHNETEDKLVISTKNELTTEDNNDILQDLPTTYKNLYFLLSNKLQSIGNNQENKQTSSNLIKKCNNSNYVDNLIKQKKSFSKKSVLELFMKRSSTEKLNGISNQSLGLLLKKDTNNSIKKNSITHLSKNKKNDSHKKNNIKREKSSKSNQKKIKIKISSNSLSCSSLSKNSSPKYMSMRSNRLFHNENSNKKMKNPNLIYLRKFDDQINISDSHDENHSPNKQKHNTKNKKTIKKTSKKKLSLPKDNYNYYPNIIRTTKSLKTPKSSKNIGFKLKQQKNSSNSSITITSESNKNSILNLKSESSLSPNNVMIDHNQPEKKKTKFKRKKKKILTFSNCMQECVNNLKSNNRRKKESKTFVIPNEIQRKNLHTILFENKPDEIQDVNKIMDIIKMDEMGKKIKETICQYDKEELIKEIYALETNDICEAIEKLPTTNNNKNTIKNDNKLSCSNNENSNNIKENIKIKFKNSEKFEKIYGDSSKTKLMVFNEKYRKLSHKILVYDSLDDEEVEEIEINYFYIEPDSIAVYFIDSIILISALIQLLYLPIFLACNFEFCRNVFSFHQFIFYLIDLFYILDFITGFFRAYYNFEESLIKNKIKMCHNYLKNWFAIDFIEAIPLYIILNSMENRCKINNNHISNHYNKNLNKFQYILLLIKSLKIFKVFSINTTLKKIKSKLNDFDFFFENKIVLFTIFLVFSSLNISSCLFIFFGRNSYPGWIIECNIQNKSFSYIYLTAIYYLITSVTTVGYGDIIVTSLTERIYQIIILIVGTCTYSWTISFISNYIKKIHEKSVDLEKKMSILKDIKLTSQNFTSELYDKISRYLQYNSVEKKNNNEILINCLPYPLKNTLFMEMYKNIIQNFKFFKSFENSNFIVKVVTCLKPVLSIKNDILVQDGDFMEDIIFVKEGVLSLEISIDLNYAQESIEGYLNERSFGKSSKLISFKKKRKSDSHLYSYINSFNSNDIKFNESNTNLTKEKDINENNKKYLRVLEIRKNEYYGDVLMFLNERAPLRVKVKSKKAELFYLSKTDAVEISTLYPNIWKRIIQKSLFNMKQIKHLTRKILIYFSKLNGIILNEDVRKYLNSSDSSISKSNFNTNSQIFESSNKSLKSICKQEENIIQNNINDIIPTVIYEEENETFRTILTNSKLNHEIYDINKLTPNLSFGNKQLSISHSESKKNIKNINSNIKSNQNLQSKFKADTGHTSKENFIEDSKDLNSAKTEKLPICNNTNSFSDYTEIEKYCGPVMTEYEINSEIYPNEKLNDNGYLNSDFSKTNKNSDNDNEKNVYKKIIMKCVDNQFTLSGKNEKKCENDENSLKINDKKITNFENLTIVNTISATISSIYENLNQMTKYKFSRDINLRKKMTNFLMEELNKISSNNSFVSNFFPKIKFNNPSSAHQSPKKSIETSPKYKIKSKNPDIEGEIFSSMTSKKEEFSEFKDNKSLHQIEKHSPKVSKSDSLNYLTPVLNKSNILKKNYSLFKTLHHHSFLKNDSKNRTEKSFEIIKKRYKSKRSAQNLAYFSPDKEEKEDKELNFYGKMKTMRRYSNNILTIRKNNRLLSTPKKNNYLDIISHNINENRKTLNNPQEFYMGFFANIVQNSMNQNNICKGKRSIKSKKDISIKKIGEVNKNRSRNLKLLFDNNDEGKIKLDESQKDE